MSKTKDTIRGIVEEMRSVNVGYAKDWAARIEAVRDAEQKAMKAFLWNIVQEATDGDKSEGMRLGWILASVSTALGNTVGSAFAEKAAE